MQLTELSTLSQTLLIPLAVRANEMRQKSPLFTDSMAIEILEQCDTSQPITDGGELAVHGILARTVTIDAVIQKLLLQIPQATIINLGAGLDTRFFRLDNGMVQWYDLDLPEVIALRRQCIPSQERLHLIAQSILNPCWVKEISVSPDDTIIFIAEGLLMYFTEVQVKEALNILVSHFPKADLLFDVVHPFFTGQKISTEFLWGIQSANEIQCLQEKISLVQSFCTGKLLKQRQSLPLRLLNVFPSTRKRSQILHVSWKG